MEKYINKVKPLYFQVLMIIITLVSSSTYLRIKFGSYAIYGLAFGVFIIVLTMFSGSFKRVLSERINWLLIAFSAFYLVSIIVCRQSELINNLKQLIFMVVFFYLFTMLPSIDSDEEKEKCLRIVVWVYVVVTFVIAIVSFYMFLIGFSSVGVDPETGLTFYLGMTWTRLSGIYNSNTSASIFSTSFILSLALIFDYKHEKNDAFRNIVCAVNVLNLLLQLSCVILAASRGANYSLCCAVFAFAFFAFYTVKSNKKLFLRILVSFCMGVIFLMLFLGFMKIMQVGIAYLPSFFENNSPSVSSVVYSPQKIEIEFEKTNIDRDYSDDITTGRMDIWKAGIAIFRDNWMLGIPYESLKDLGNKYFEALGVDSSYLNSGGTFHNILLSCLVSSGVLGFIPMVAYIVIKIIKSLKVILSQTLFSPIYILPFIVVLMAIANEMVESRILYSVNILNVIFWIMMGYLPNEKKDAT